MNAEIFNKPQLNDKILIKRPFFGSSRCFLKVSPDSAREGSFGGFYVKV